MKTLIVTHYFPPEIGAPQTRLGESARAWTAAGDEVTVLTGMPSHPTGIIPAAYRGKKLLTETKDGYRIVRTWTYATPNERIVRKTLAHLSFMFSSLLLGARRSGSADVVVVSSPTFFSIFSAYLLAKMKSARFVVEVRDLWPGIFVELGVLTNKRLISLLERLEMWAYRKADAIVTVSEGFTGNIVQRGISADKVHTIYNGVDLDRFAPDRVPDPAIRKQLGADPSETLVLYIGAHGISHALPSVAEAAKKLAGEKIHLAFVGEGSAKKAVADKVRELGLDNVSMLPGVPSDEVPGLVAAADICLVPLRDIQLFETFIPSKMFEFFAAGKAVVGSVSGEAARMIAAAGGRVVPPEDPSALAETLKELADDPEARTTMGMQGRRYVERNFDRRVLADRYRTILLGLLSKDAR